MFGLSFCGKCVTALVNLKYLIRPLGDEACTIVFGDSIEKATNEIVLLAFRHFQSRHREYITGLVPSYASLTVFYDAVAVLQQPVMAQTSYEIVSNYLIEELKQLRKEDLIVSGRTIRVPVCYSGEYAPDLSLMAASLQLTTTEIVRMHQGKNYRVYMIGFQPGFAYMGEVDERIAFPRKNKPARRVAAGSVGIAGRQTGIYPFDSPGGWMIIGRTPMNIFNKKAADPVFFHPGDTVSFYPITENEFENYKGGDS